MPNLSASTLILAVPGTQETRELDLKVVQDAVARGEIALDNWVWCPSHNSWMPLAQLPGFIASPTTEVYEEPVPVSPAPILQARVAPIVVQVPKVTTPVVAAAVPVIGTPNRMPATYYSKPMEESHEFPIFKVLFVVLALIIGSVVGVNYYLVDQPYQQNLATTPFASVQTHAHLGAFIQPQALLIHVFPSATIKADNFTDLLTTLARSAPSEAFAGKPFTSISLTSSWLSQYTMSAEDWKAFPSQPSAQKKQYLLDHLELNTGASLVPFVPRESADAHTARQDKSWDDLVAGFEPKTP